MGLDIYAGTLTRYYSHNWKTVVLQWAEENGYTFNRITPDGEPADNEEELSPAEVLAAVENWRDQILSAISQPGQPPYAPWIEDNEKPYYTAPERSWTRWWNPLCKPSGRQDSGRRRMRRAISSTGRKQIRRSAPFGYGISSPTPAACRKSLSRKSWSFGGSCSQKRRRKPNEQ